MEIDKPIDDQTPALYITARPNKPDNVPKAILDGSRGKPPPVLIARYPLPKSNSEDLDWNTQFPFEFTLTENEALMKSNIVLPLLITRFSGTPITSCAFFYVI